jgi:hypothetical protein
MAHAVIFGEAARTRSKTPPMKDWRSRNAHTTTWTSTCESLSCLTFSSPSFSPSPSESSFQAEHVGVGFVIERDGDSGVALQPVQPSTGSFLEILLRVESPTEPEKQHHERASNGAGHAQEQLQQLWL